MTVRGIRLFHHDLPKEVLEEIQKAGSVAVDTEAMGLSWRDRLCLVQLSTGNGVAYLVQIAPKQKEAPHLQSMLINESIEKVYHYGRFDIGIMYRAFGSLSFPNYCTKLASRFARTYTERHGLKSLCQELLSIDLSKSQQSSDWGADILTEQQKHYAASDVLYLHALKEKLDLILKREGKYDLFRGTCDFLHTRALLDCKGFTEDLFVYM